MTRIEECETDVRLTLKYAAKIAVEASLGLIEYVDHFALQMLLHTPEHARED